MARSGAMPKAGGLIHIRPSGAEGLNLSGVCSNSACGDCRDCTGYQPGIVLAVILAPGLIVFMYGFGL